MTRVLHYSSQVPNVPGWAAITPEPVTTIPADRVPSVQELTQFDVISVIGHLGDTQRSRQFGAAVRLALREKDGMVVVAAFPGQPDDAHRLFVVELVAINYQGIGQSRVDSVSDAFADYFHVFGRTAIAFNQIDGAETLATVRQGPEVWPAAICGDVDGGLVYVVPYELAGAEAFFVESLFGSVLRHASGAVGNVPEFLADLMLPGEADLHAEIAQAEEALENLRTRAAYLEHFRHLVGPRGSGSFLEDLIIETLNVILERTDFRAEDRDDVRTEDFWIVGPHGDTALAESKGVNHNVRREDVNQVDNHREALPEAAQRLPGLLIVNIFRSHDDLDQHRLPVPEPTVRRAAQSDVLVLRTVDLFQLLATKLAGDLDVGTRFIEYLGQGGGWLEVAEQGESLRDH